MFSQDGRQKFSDYAYVHNGYCLNKLYMEGWNLCKTAVACSFVQSHVFESGLNYNIIYYCNIQNLTWKAKREGMIDDLEPSLTFRPYQVELSFIMIQ